MIEYLPDREPRAALYDLVSDYPLRPSKMLRSTLCIASCRAHGGTVDDALASATAIELLHNAFMIHDDIEDDSDIRRGRPTLHRQYGVPIALNVGDATSFVAMRPLLANESRHGLRRSWRMLGEVMDAISRTIEGQAIELGWMRNGDFEVDERAYMEMVLLKTCWYTTILPCRLGAMAAGVELPPDAFVGYGTYLGTAFQIRDDVLNLSGSVDDYGKEIGGDIVEGKRTLMLIHLLQSCTDLERDIVKQIYERPPSQRTPSDVDIVIDLMRRHGSLDHASASAHGLAGAALNEFELELGHLPAGEDRQFLQDVVIHLVGRQR